MDESSSPDVKPNNGPSLPNKTPRRDYYSDYFSEAPHPNIKPRLLPPLKGKIAHRYNAEIALSAEYGLEPYKLETVELAVDRLGELMQKQGKEFSPDGIVSFACDRAHDERLLAEWYGLKINKNHFYDISMSEKKEYLLKTAGIPHKIDIFRALAQPQKYAHKGNLFFMKGIDFFGEWSPYAAEERGKNAQLFRENIQYFLADTALVFIDNDNPVLDNMENQGFTRFSIENPEIEEESGLAVYLYQRPQSSSPASMSSNNASR